MPTDADLATLEVSIANDLAVVPPAGSVAFTEAVQERIDQLAKQLANGLEVGTLVRVPQELRHFFLPGMYVREITLRRGSITVSKIHATEHPFVVSKGAVRVFTEGIGWETIRAPYLGVTKPMTRRVLLVFEDLVWTTFHATNAKTVEDVEAEIIVDRKELPCHSQQ